MAAFARKGLPNFISMVIFLDIFVCSTTWWADVDFTPSLLLSCGINHRPHSAYYYV